MCVGVCAYVQATPPARLFVRRAPTGTALTWREKTSSDRAPATARAPDRNSQSRRHGRNTPHVAAWCPVDLASNRHHTARAALCRIARPPHRLRPCLLINGSRGCPRRRRLPPAPARLGRRRRSRSRTTRQARCARLLASTCPGARASRPVPSQRCARAFVSGHEPPGCSNREGDGGRGGGGGARGGETGAQNMPCVYTPRQGV